VESLYTSFLILTFTELTILLKAGVFSEVEIGLSVDWVVVFKLEGCSEDGRVLLLLFANVRDSIKWLSGFIRVTVNLPWVSSTVVKWLSEFEGFTENLNWVPSVVASVK